MTTSAPATQGYNFTHMYDFTDFRSNREVQMCENPNSMYFTLKKSGKFNRFLEIVKNANFSAQLNAEQANFTLFVPTDDSILQSQAYFEKMDSGMARQILDASMLRRRIDKTLIESCPVAYYPTLSPTSKMYITNISGNTVINQQYRVKEYDIKCSNGLIHIVDGLIQPTLNVYMN
jgi:uncharacterized surface protein with fasciclin (FAS1) repeats